jgi:hypothetical protein
MLPTTSAAEASVGLDYFDDDWPEIEVPSHWRNLEPFAGNDEALIYRKRFDPRCGPPRGGGIS